MPVPLRAPPLLFPAATKHTATVIFLHGLGDTGRGWTDAVENWRRRQRLDEVKFVLPHAPVIPITANWGVRMTGWYDIAVLDGSIENLQRNEDEAGIVRSKEYIHTLIQHEINAGIPADRIVLGGFSQGGAMSIFAGLTAKVKLAGIVALSSYLLLSAKFAQLTPKPEFNKDTPILMAHGAKDRVVRIDLAQESMERLKNMGYSASLEIYESLEHNACLQELEDVESFLRDRLPELYPKPVEVIETSEL